METNDITERKRAEKALRRSEGYLAEAERLTHTGSWADDGMGHPLYWSEEHYRIFGLDPQQGLPTRDQPLERIHPDDRDKVLQAFEKAFHEKVDSEAEYRIVLPDGTLKYAHSIGHPVLDESGDLVEILGTTVDITEHKRTEGVLRRIEAYLAEAQRLTHTGSWAGDGLLRPLYWSEEHYRIFGLDPKQGLPTREQPLERIHPDDRGAMVQAFETGIRGKVDFEAYYRIVLPDGAIKHVHGIGHPVLNANGELVEVIGTTVDITERKRAEEERARLRHLETELAHINRVSIMGELTASIAHEVNQPLSGVVSNGSACLRWLAGDTPNIEEARETARRIVRDGKRAAEIIGRIRALTKRTATPREKLDLNETMREILQLVGDEAKKKSVTIRTCFADNIFPVLGDRVQLQQVVLNLVMNAIEAMNTITERAREVVITSRNIDSDQVEVTVEDSGTGLDPEASVRIYDAFYTTKPSGMGMGLSICRSILQAHDGRLWATANHGAGTTFHFALPKEKDGNAEPARV
jgi:PAS domain S-box-containing protein